VPDRREIRGDEEGRETGASLVRLIAFSDGVFSIAMTLLVLNLRIPDLVGANQSERLWEIIRDQSPELLSYAISFAVIGRYWIVHHRTFRLVRVADTRLLVLNLVFLGCIAVVPWPTEILGRYGDTTTAVVLYSVVMTATGIANAAVTWHLDNADLLDERVGDTYKRHALVRALMMPLVFAISIPIAFVSTQIALFSWLITPMFLRLTTHFFGSITQPYEAEAEA
jgi:uncharacterized membrane protein